MYCGHASLCVCLSVRGRTPTLLHGPGCNLGRGRGCPLVVHYRADLQSVHRLRCYGNITRTQNVSEYMLVLALCIVIIIVIRPHRRTTYVDAAYCYRPSSVVGFYVDLSITLVSPTKRAEPIEIPFWLRTRVGPRNHVLDGSPDHPMERGNFGEMDPNCKV